MTTYVALLRGIGPMNPAMRNENLRRVCEGEGFGDVATVISSGNVVFTSDRTDQLAIEADLENAWSRELGFESLTIVRSKAVLEGLVALDPFPGLTHSPQTYLLTTFFKQPLDPTPEQPTAGSGFEVVGISDAELFSVTDTTTGTTDVMAWLEGTYGQRLTSRTWLTVHRILEKMSQIQN